LTVERVFMAGKSVRIRARTTDERIHIDISCQALLADVLEEGPS